jgi:reactive chlorine resistance protein C
MTTSTMDSEKSGVGSPRPAPTSGSEHPRPVAASTREARLVLPLAASGIAVLRYGLAFLLLLWGGFKFLDFEAQAIVPLVENSPWLGWMYDVFGVRGTSALFGVAEVGAGLAIAARRFFPRVSGYGSLVAALVFLSTLSFLLTTPGVFALDNPWGGFLMKDIVLLGAALVTAAEAFAARWRPAEER